MNKDLTISLYAAINENDRPRDIRNWHASSLAKCPRALYFERKGIPGLKENEPGGGKKLRWRSGHAIEGTIRPELEKIYPKLLTNVRFTNEELDLTGEFDAYDPESKTLISVKSVHDFAFTTENGVSGLKDRVGTKISPKTGKEIGVWGLKKEPYLHHQWQEHAYILLMSDPKSVAVKIEIDPGKEVSLTYLPEEPWEIETITYIYITLGGLIACYTTPISPDILMRVSNKVNYLTECWEESKLPICLCQEGQEMYDVQDRYCPYKTETGCCDESLLKEVV